MINLRNGLPLHLTIEAFEGSDRFGKRLSTFVIVFSCIRLLAQSKWTLENSNVNFLVSNNLYARVGRNCIPCIMIEYCYQIGTFTSKKIEAALRCHQAYFPDFSTEVCVPCC